MSVAYENVLSCKFFAKEKINLNIYMKIYKSHDDNKKHSLFSILYILSGSLQRNLSLSTPLS